MHNQISRLISANSFYQKTILIARITMPENPPIYGYQSTLQEIKNKLFCFGLTKFARHNVTIGCFSGQMQVYRAFRFFHNYSINLSAD